MGVNVPNPNIPATWGCSEIPSGYVNIILIYLLATGGKLFKEAKSSGHVGTLSVRLTLVQVKA